MKQKNLFVFSVLFLLGWVQTVFGQQEPPFQGQIVYAVRFVRAYDSTVYDHSIQTIYTNDTLVRTESFSEQLGPQVVIKHLLLGKYYILLEANDQKYAIQQVVKTDSLVSAYRFRKRFGKRTVFGQTVRKVEVSHPNWPKSKIIWYFPSISAKLIDAYPGIPGLPLAYEIHTEDGIYQYTLQKVSVEPVSREMFGIPSHFKRVTFDQFMDDMMKQPMQIKSE